MLNDDALSAARDATLWKRREETLQARAFAASQREIAAHGRADGARVRSEAAGIRAGAAATREGGARVRDDAARVRDDAARVRDHAARARDAASKLREESLRQRVSHIGGLDSAAWAALVELDREASAQIREASNHDREAAALDRAAAEKDREASHRDRGAAESDRRAADKDREASDKEADAAEADRAAADSDRLESDRMLELADARLTRMEKLTALGRLAAGLAHEINNPLTVITASLEGVQLDVAAGVRPEAVLSLVADAQTAAKRIANVVRDVRAWLSDGGVEEPEPVPIDLAKLIDESMRLTHGAVERAAHLRIDLQPTPVILGVPGRLSQVLVNLLMNAVFALSSSRDANTIGIRVFAGTGATVVIEVTDTGTGIHPEVLPHIFDPFFTTSEASGGMGLGLSMCRRIIASHLGTLTARSAPGVGTTMRIELPTAAPATGAATGAAPTE